MMAMSKRQYSKGEEIANAVTHGIGAVCAMAVLTLLVVFGAFYGDAWYVVSVSVYGAMLIIMYLMSTLYHALVPQKAKAVFKIFDHSAIYLLIAGTYTPYALTVMRDNGGWVLFGIIWGIALVGTGICCVPKANSNKIISALVYIAMGWIMIFYIKPLASAVSTGTIIWLIIGGVFYTVGVAFYVIKKIPYMHAVWHLFVLLGSLAHFASIFCLLPMWG